MNGPTEDLMSYLSAIDSKSRCGWGRASFARQKGNQSSWIGSGSEYLSFSSSRVCELEIQRITCRLVPANERVPFQCTLFLGGSCDGESIGVLAQSAFRIREAATRNTTPRCGKIFSYWRTARRRDVLLLIGGCSRSAPSATRTPPQAQRMQGRLTNEWLMLSSLAGAFRAWRVWV
jgi:hypothetical protein